MNIVFYFLIVLALVFLWFTLAFVFKPIGKYIYGLYEDAKDQMTEEKE